MVLLVTHLHAHLGRRAVAPDLDDVDGRVAGSQHEAARDTLRVESRLDGGRQVGHDAQPDDVCLERVDLPRQ